MKQMERTMLDERKLPRTFWVEVVHTTIHIFNKSHITTNSNKIPHGLWFGRPTSIKHFQIFVRKCYIRINVDNLGKFDSRVYEDILLGYATKHKNYRCCNKILDKKFDCIYVKADEVVG